MATDPTAGSEKSVALFSSQAGISVYDIAADEVVTLDEPTALGGLRPTFRTSGLVSFVHLREQPDEIHPSGQDSLYEIALDTGRPTEILRLPGSLLGYDWSPDGKLLAYQLRSETPSELLPVALCLFNSQTASVSLLRSLEVPFLTGTGQREETRVTWSPSGRYILSVETAAQPSMFVVDMRGRDVVEPRNGTFARWSSNDTVLYQVDTGDATNPWEWFTVAAATGRTRPFGLPDHAYRPALSPRGDLVAYDDGDAKTPSIFIFNVDRGTSQRVARGYVGPIWLGPDNPLAVSAAGPCSGGFCPIPWSALGSVVGIDPRSGDQTPLTLPTTLQRSNRYGVIDVYIALSGS